MKEINIQEMRAKIGRLDELVATEGELVVSRRGQPIARILPIAAHRQLPDHAELRERMARVQRSSAELIREERDER